MIKVLLVDDSAIVRKTIKTTLNKHPEIQVVGECKDGTEVIPFLQHLKPDIILMDYRMPLLNGLETTKQVKEFFPKIKIIGFSSADDEHIKTTFLLNGAYSFLSKYDANIDTLIEKINNCCSTI